MTKAPRISDAREKTQRRVYVLPTELVERIAAYQGELGLSSEVEAVRRLLDDALKSRDTIYSIVSRLATHMATVRSLRDAAREILVNHPLVSALKFEEYGLEILLSNGTKAVMDSSGKATIRDEDNNVMIIRGKLPGWASDEHIDLAKRYKPNPIKGQAGNLIDDDEIPF